MTTPPVAIGVITGVEAPAATPAGLAAEKEAGVTARTFELSWRRAEPQPGVFNSRYLAAKQNELAMSRKAGFLLALDFGLQYPPDWVQGISPGALFRDQFGDVYTSNTPGKANVNLVFDQKVRDAAAAYLREVFTSFGTDFSAVRVGGLGNGELHYPEGGLNGHVAPIWAYDPVAQGSIPGLSTGLAENPVPGWRPGDPDPSGQKASLLFHWYVAALADWQNWQIRAVRTAGLTGSIYVLLGAYGMRNGTVDEVRNAIESGLQNCVACDMHTMTAGQDWIGLVHALPADPLVFPYTTWLDGPTDADDTSANRQSWSPARYLSWVAHGAGRRIGGENAGDSDQASLQRAVANAAAANVVAFYWYGEPQLFSGMFATLGDLRAAIGSLRQ